MISPRFILVAAAVGVIAGCNADDAGSPSPVEVAKPLAAGVTAVPTFLPPDPTAPAIANPVISFWAKRGAESEVFMYYAPRPGETDSTVFIRFRVRKKSLAFYPNGQPFAIGDSVLITLTFVDPVTREVDFHPAGLVFKAGDPAKLKISYLEADDDYNQDGSVDDADTRLQKSFKIWKLHPPNPWAPQTSAVTRSTHEVETNVLNFTRYAIAY